MPTNYGSVPTTEGEETKPSFRKSRRCNDIIFAIAFLAHLGVIIAAWVTYEPRQTEEGAEIQDFADRGVWKFVGTCAAVALILSTLTLFL